MDSPLADIRILAIEQYAAGPYATMHLADLGADVIKIEHPRGGDVGRQIPPGSVGDDSLFFQSLNRNKRSVCLDLTTSTGVEAFHDLVTTSDAVFSNLRGDVPGNLGIRYADLCKVNPRIVCCSLTGFGMSGPRSSQPGFDYMMQGIAGWMSLTGEPGSPPTKSGLSVVDFASGLAAASSILVGVHAARTNGIGGDCDLSLLDTAVSMLNYIVAWQSAGVLEARRVARSNHQTLYPFGNFPTRDGWIVAGGSKEKFWQGLCHALGLPELIEDPRFATFQDRMNTRDELQTILDQRFASRRTHEWLELLERFSVPCAPVNSVEDAMRDPQVRSRRLVFDIAHDTFGSVTHVRSPVRFREESVQPRGAPKLGEHTYEVLGALGWSADDVSAMLD